MALDVAKAPEREQTRTARVLRWYATRPSARALKLLLGVVTLFVAVVVGALVGPAGLGARGVVLELLDGLPLVSIDSGLSRTQEAILWQIRLPRVVLGALVGATLAVAGTAYQGVFRNPLADPYLLGVSSGAGLGATLGIVSGGSIGAAGIPVLAFLGGVIGVAATYALGSTVGGARGAVAIVLAGVAVGAFFNAIQNYVQQRYDDSLLAVYSWMLGRLSTEGWSDVVIALPYVVVSCGAILLYRRTLDVMAVGDVEAASLGINPARVRLILVLAATLGTAAVVSVSGLIGFVGIVVPHTVRLLFGAAHHTLIPLSLLFGAAFLVLADVLARAATAPAELPIGVVTAIVGAPFFVIVLRRYKGAL